MKKNKPWIEHNTIMQDRSINGFPSDIVVMSSDPVRHFDINMQGEDWFVGDAHGTFDRLDLEMQRAGFDPQRDRLFMVGDLIDRGVDSLAAIEFLARPYVHSVRGNHDQFLLDSQHDEDIKKFWLNSGMGLWSLAASNHEMNELYHALKALPLAMEVQTAYGRFGVVHAEVPIGASWDRFIQQLQLENSPETADVYPVASISAQWSRFRSDFRCYEDFSVYLRRNSLPQETHDWFMRKKHHPCYTKGIDAVIMGHSPMSSAGVFMGNHAWIDTGASKLAQKTGVNQSIFGLFRASEIASRLSMTCENLAVIPCLG